MKKIGLLALFTIAFAMTSCEAEEIPEETLSISKKEPQVLTDEILRVGTGIVKS